MPIPKPRKDELRDKFIKRCMSNDLMNDEYPDNKQRMAVCSTQWRNRNKEIMMNTIYKYFTIDKGEFDEKDFTVTATASKEVIDRDGDLIKVDGIELKNWKKNPVIMLFHNYHDFPVGVGVGKKAWVDGKDLKVKFKFLIDDNDKAFQAARLWKAGALKGLSVGFTPDYNEIDYPEQKGAKQQPRRIFKKVELLEVSVVPIPANQDALMASVSKSLDNGEIDMEDFDILKNIVKESPEVKVVEKVVDNKELDTKTKELEQKVIDLELKVKEHELEQELKGYEVEDDYLSEIFGTYGATGDNKSADGDHTDVKEDYLDILIGE
jgi:HK97 family phage prohead protease